MDRDDDDDGEWGNGLIDEIIRHLLIGFQEPPQFYCNPSMGTSQQ